MLHCCTVLIGRGWWWWRRGRGHRSLGLVRAGGGVVDAVVDWLTAMYHVLCPIPGDRMPCVLTWGGGVAGRGGARGGGTRGSGCGPRCTLWRGHGLSVPSGGSPTHTAEVQESRYKTRFYRHDISKIYIVKLRRGSGKDRQGMAVKEKGLKA